MGKSNSKLHPLDQELRAKVVLKSWKKEDLEMQIQDNPEDPMVMVEYGIYLARKEGNFKEAEQMFERALHMDRNNPDACGAYALYLEAERKDIEKAGEYYETGYNAVCLRAALTEMDANLLCNYAMYCTNIKHNLKKAEDLYKRILISHPNHTEANGNYGQLLKNHLKNLDKAEEKLLKACESAPDDPHYYLVLGRFYSKFKKNSKLAKEYNKKGKDLQKAKK